jgi:hypothetical protein
MFNAVLTLCPLARVSANSRSNPIIPYILCLVIPAGGSLKSFFDHCPHSWMPHSAARKMKR